MQAQQKTGAAVKNFFKSLLSLGTNKFFIFGLLALILLVGAGYLLVDRVIMPSYARHNVSITVPDVNELPIEEAQLLLENLNLQAHVESGRYNPNLPRNIVVDQNPKANMFVQPGRRVYLTINTGSTPEVTVPSIEGISLTEAQNQLFAAGLRAEKSDIRPDSIPFKVKNLVTRQYPAAGTVIEEGSRVRIWYSTGLGNSYSTVPNVVGMTARDAKRTLLSLKLRSIVLGAGEHPNPMSLPVVVQGQAEGTRTRQGTEIRLFVKPPVDAEN
ncbi:MAG: PASTA domain-containing protein [Bacteroidota bacterium]